MTEYVVPRSSEAIIEDGDYILVSVVMFKTVAEKFKNEARTKHRFTVRRNDPSNSMTESEKESLKEKRAKLRSSFERWASTQYAEIFLSWLHLKCIQCYVESILRFGLPAEFQAMCILPKKGSEKKLEKCLCQLYSYLGRDFDKDDKELEGLDEGKVALLGIDKFYPYVFSEIPTDMTRS